MAKTIDNAGKRLSTTLKRATLVPAAGLLILALVLITLIGYLLSTVYWVNHSNGVITQGRYAEKLLLDVQTATRGYYLSGESSFLQPFTDSYQKIRPALNDLDALVQDSPDQRERTKRLTRDAEEWLDLTMMTLADVEASGGRPPGYDRVVREKELFDEIRLQVGQILDQEYAFRSSRTNGAFRQGLWMTGIAVGVATILGLIQTLVTRGHLREVAETYRETLEISEHRNHLVRDVLRDIDKEMKAVADIQRSLLPIELPKIPKLRLAASYQTSTRVGGDYYDFFPLPKLDHEPADAAHRWGILIADVSGHGTPAAVLMAVTHSIAHGFEHPSDEPGRLLKFVNERLCRGYTIGNGTFVTAFYAIYDPNSNRLTYSSAGHNPPLLGRAGRDKFMALDDAQGFPLGVDVGEIYPDRSIELQPGDTLVLYTDGIVEARNESDENFGVERLEAAIRLELNHSDVARGLTDVSTVMESALAAVALYATGQEDDRTLLVVQVTHADTPEGPAHTAIVETARSLLETVDA